MKKNLKTRKQLDQRFRDDLSYGRFIVTMVCKNRKSVFGRIDGSRMIEFDFTARAAEVWKRLAEFYPQIQLGEYIFMPDHFHGLITLNHDPKQEPVSLAKVIHLFKTMSSLEYVRYGNSKGINPIGSLWQRGYNEGYLPNNQAYYRAVQYIRDNPKTYHSKSNTR